MISECSFFNTISDSQGGVIYGDNSNFSVLDCDIYDNFAGELGGFVSAYRCKMDISGCKISSNKAGLGSNSYGGAIYATNSDLRIQNSFIADNYAQQSGSVLRLENSNGWFIGCNITTNTSEFGSCLHFQSCDTIAFENCEIVRNVSSEGTGGAMAIGGNTEVTLVNSTIAHNYAKLYSGGIYIYGTGMEIRLFNSILTENIIENSVKADVYSGSSFSNFYGFNCCISDDYNSNLSPQLLNCINQNPQFRDVSEDTLTGTIEFTRLSDVVTGTDSKFTEELVIGDSVYLVADGEEKKLCVKEIISDTKLILSTIYKGDGYVPGDAKYIKTRLDLQRISDGDANDSPCIDKGDNQFVNSVLDILGGKRIVDGDSDSDVVVDMGAREKQ